MSGLLRLRMIMAGCVTALALAACGDSNDNDNNGGGSTSNPAPPAAPGAPAVTGNIAVDGRNWINFRRSQVGMPTLVHNPIIDIAAQSHSEYQRTNNTVTHTQTPGKPGFTGVDLFARLAAAGYQFNPNANRAYGEVISASSSTSGVFLAEELITAIYHRFVIFEPVFKEVGTGAASTSAGYTYFTANFTANNGYGPGVGGNVAVWPFSGQTDVPVKFFSDFEAPDPVPNQNEVGYPISVHTNISSRIEVQTFTVRPRGGANLSVRLLRNPDDLTTPQSAAAIIPLARLAPATTYDVTFAGNVDGAAVDRTWSFTTK